MTRNLALALSLAAVIGASSAAGAVAQGADSSDKAEKRLEMMNKRFERLDKNKDGAISRDEAETPLIRAFDRADKNKDGVVDAAEIKAIADRAATKNANRGQKLAKRFERADSDRDGKVTRAEFLAKMPRWLARADDNGDGRVTKAEMDMFAEKRMQKRASKEN